MHLALVIGNLGSRVGCAIQIPRVEPYRFSTLGIALPLLSPQETVVVMPPFLEILVAYHRPGGESRHQNTGNDCIQRTPGMSGKPQCPGRDDQQYPK